MTMQMTYDSDGRKETMSVWEEGRKSSKYMEVTTFNEYGQMVETMEKENPYYKPEVPEPTVDKYGDVTRYNEDGQAIDKTHSYYENYDVVDGKLEGVGEVQTAVVEQYEYDEEGRLVNVKKKSMSFDGEQMHEVWLDNIHEYDDEGNLKSITAYNADGEVMQVIHMEEGGSYAVDSEGKMFWRESTDENGQKIRTNYNPETGEVTSTENLNEDGEMTQRYDADGQLISEAKFDDNGRMTEVMNYFYDESGNLTTKVKSLYDEFGNIGVTMMENLLPEATDPLSADVMNRDTGEGGILTLLREQKGDPDYEATDGDADYFIGIGADTVGKCRDALTNLTVDNLKADPVLYDYFTKVEGKTDADLEGIVAYFTTAEDGPKYSNIFQLKDDIKTNKGLDLYSKEQYEDAITPLTVEAVKADAALYDYFINTEGKTEADLEGVVAYFTTAEDGPKYSNIFQLKDDIKRNKGIDLYL
ncbi:hypothetical protein ACFLTD_02080 [Elusimicrobiota bacterium]